MACASSVATDRTVVRCDFAWSKSTQMNTAEGGLTRRTLTGMLWAAGVFLGPDALWVLEALRRFLPQRLSWRRRARATEPLVYQHAAIGEVS